MRENILCYINGERIEIKSEHTFMTVAQYLRYQKGLTGTKIVCSEGDCGACTVLVSRMVSGKMTAYKSINSCISFMYLLDRCHLVTVEGLGDVEHLHPAQEEMVKCHGSQCGYCTPGFICAMANMAEDLKATGKKSSTQKIKNYLTGNLCRCTGYEPIIKAGEKINLEKVEPLSKVYNEPAILEDFLTNASECVKVQFEDQEVYLPSKFREVVSYKNENKNSKIAAGATDLGVLHNKGRVELTKVLCLNNLGEAYKVFETKDSLEIGAKASLDDVEKACLTTFPEFSRKLHIFASPQIKNKGTLVGNLVNASPIGDSIPFLRVAEANIVLAGNAGLRILNINDFFLGGYKEIDLKPNEFVFKISLPITEHEFKLYKVSLRKDLDISSVTFACRYKIESGIITDISFAFGGVGPVVIRITDLENMAKGQKFTKELFVNLAKEIKNHITPMSDLRGTKEFRELVSHNLLLKFYDEVSSELGLGTKEASL
jgi:xanthine dehydrogenase small subunit